MSRTFTLYIDQLKRVIATVEENCANNVLAERAISVVVSDEDNCLKMFQKVGHDWLFLNDDQFCDWR